MSEDKKQPEEMEEMMVDVVTFVDDEGNELDMEIIEEFDHNGKRYAVLAELCDCEEEDHVHDEDEHEESLYVFEVVPGDDGDDYRSIEDDALMGELSEIIEEMLFAEEEDQAE